MSGKLDSLSLSLKYAPSQLREPLMLNGDRWNGIRRELNLLYFFNVQSGFEK